MPGPFSSESYRGTFDNDISKIKQNEILSSKTFNNFVRSLYNLFYTDSVYRNVYKSSGQEASSIIMTEANAQANVQGPGWNSSDPDSHPIEHEMATTYLWIKNVDNSYDPETYENDPKGHLCIAPVSSDTDVLNDLNLNNLADEASDSPEHLFYGTGDVSVSVKPYALFRTAVNDNSYCCITYLYGEHTGDDVSGYSEGTYTPKYSSMAELVFIYDPTIDSGDTAIRKVWGMSGSAITNEEGLPTGEAYTRLTIIYGSAVTLAHLKAFLDSLTFQAEESSTETQNVFKTVFVGDVDQNIFLYQLFAYLEDMKKYGTARASLDQYTRDNTQAFTRVTRFVPVRSSIKISNPSMFWENLTAPTELAESQDHLEVDPSAITAYVGKYSVTNTEQTDDSDQAGRLRFTHTGVYGFIINNNLNSDNMELYSDGQPARFIYIPNKEHYGSNHYVPGTDSTAIPDWAASNEDGGLPDEIERALTTDFDANYFFLPLVTVTDTMLMFAGGGVISLRDAVFNGNTVISIPADGSGTNYESGIIYDAWNHPARCNDKLVDEAKLVYGKYRRGLRGVYQKAVDEDEPELIDLDTFDPKPVNSLVRTLQMMTGLTWQLSNIVWIDPFLKQGDGDASSPALKMFSGYEKIFEYEDEYSGPNSILSPGTVVIYVARTNSYTADVVFKPEWGDRLAPNMTHYAVTLNNAYAITDERCWLDPYAGSVKFLVDNASQDAELYFNRQVFLCGVGLAPKDTNTVMVKTLRIVECKATGIGASSSVHIFNSVWLQDSVIESCNFNTAAIAFAGKLTLKNTRVIITPSKYSTIDLISNFFPPEEVDKLISSLVYLFELKDSNINLELRFQDWLHETHQWKEHRDLTKLHSVISSWGNTRNNTLNITVEDYGNSAPFSPDGGKTTYPQYTYTAFDPDLFFPKAEDNESNLQNDVMFFSTAALYGGDSWGGRLINTILNVSLFQSTQFDLREAYSIKPGGDPEYRDCNKFFTSRILRRAPYVFYFGGVDPRSYSEGFLSEHVTLTVRQISSVNTFIDIRSDLRNDATGKWPQIPEKAVSNTSQSEPIFTNTASRIFISGLSNSEIRLPKIFLPPVTKRNFLSQTSLDTKWAGLAATPPTTRRGTIALFEAVSNCNINIEALDTTYPIQDEWYYDGVDYTLNPTEPNGSGSYGLVYWEEPEYGFQFFTYPRHLGNDSKDLMLNSGNKLSIPYWKTRTMLSGMFGVYCSTIDIHYVFDNQSGSFTEGFDASFTTPGGKCRHDLGYYPVGGIQRVTVPQIGQYSNITACYLPVLPMLYLAEVNSSNITFNQVATDLRLNTSPMGGTHFTDQGPQARDLYYDNPIPDFRNRDISDQHDLHRPIRLSVGYIFEVTEETRDMVAPSSYNSISCQVTRANLVLGVMNKVTGWCYKLYCTSPQDFIPQNFHRNGEYDFFDLYCPATSLGDNALINMQRYGQLGNIAECILDPTHQMLNPQGTGTLVRLAVTKELALDCSVPGHKSFASNLALLERMSFLNADYPTLSESNDTLRNPNAVVHSSDCELSSIGYTLGTPGWGYDYSETSTIRGWDDSQSPVQTGNAFAGHLPGTGVDIPSSNPSDPHLFTYTPHQTMRLTQKTPMVNALNIADLDTILIATTRLPYVSGGTSNLPQEVKDVYQNYAIEEGAPMHTVLAVGYFFNDHL